MDQQTFFWALAAGLFGWWLGGRPARPAAPPGPPPSPPPAPGGAIAEPPPGSLTIARVSPPVGSAAELTGIDPGYRKRTRSWMS